MKNGDISLDGGGTYCEGIFQASTPTWGYSPLPPTFPRWMRAHVFLCIPLVPPVHIFEELKGSVPFLYPSLLFPPFYLAYSRYVNTSPSWPPQDAKGNIYRLAGKAKRLAFQAFHRYPPSVSSDCVFMRAEIPENKSQHLDVLFQRSMTPKSSSKISWTERETYKIDHQLLLFISFNIKIFSSVKVSFY